MTVTGQFEGGFWGQAAEGPQGATCDRQTLPGR